MTRLQFWPSLLRLLACAIIGGCSTPPTPRADLLSESYKLIGRFYLEPVRVDKISEASLYTLTKLDRDITFEAQERELLVKRDAKPLARFHAASPNDWQAWGEITDRATTSAAGASPAIAKLSDDALDQVLLDGAVATLDKYSHYLSPQAAQRSILLENQHAALDTSSGEAPNDVTGAKLPGKLVRPPPSVSMREDGRFVVIHIRRFTDGTGQLMRQALTQAFTATTQRRGIILDLRDDPGGQVSAAADVADLFLDRGMVVALEGREPRDREVYSANFDDSIYERIPLVVVVNGRSASSAEVLAAALQGNGRALVVGTSTYGKGTAQRVITLANGGELWLTASYMRTPAGYLLQRHGVAPDICTDLAATTPASRLALVERFRALISRPRIALSEAEWTELRQICPPAARQSAGDLELEAAKQVLQGRANTTP